MKNTHDPVWNVSLSTMWAMKNFHALEDFFIATQQMRIAQIELNHQINSGMLAGIDLSRYSFSSIHEPCPADISTEQLKVRDWLVSSTDEACRREGVKSVQRSIDLARQIGAPVIVIHAGSIPFDVEFENQLRSLIHTGQRQSDTYNAILNQMKQLRSELAGPHFSAVKRSLAELLEYAGRAKICLGLENRYHYHEIPSPDELAALLDLSGPETGDSACLGFIYDVGHAQVHSSFGFYSQDAWLNGFAPRMIGVHLHDVIGVKDHRAPGTGEVDFSRLAASLPKDVFRTLEVRPDVSNEQMVASLNFLAEQACIRSV